MKYVTHKQVISGETTAGPLAVLLSRFVLWIRGTTVERQLRQQLAVRLEEVAEAYDLMWKAREERDALRERLIQITKPVPGEWKLTKDGTKRYRRWEYPRSRSMWRTESESI